jgi:signal transduction histidine kinase
MIRRLQNYQYAVDGALALLYFAFAYLTFGGYYPYSSDNQTLLMLAVYAVAIALRRVSPGVALAVAWVASVAQIAYGVYPSFFNVATLLVLYTTAAYGSRVVRYLGLASVGLGSAVAAAYLALQGAGIGVSDTLLGVFDLPTVILQFALLFGILVVVLGSSWLVGILMRAMMRNRESKIAREAAEQDVIVEQERNRIARDMHDVVAHSLAVVIAQADGARYARAHDPEAVDEALLAISSTARDALGDVRLLLGQLRHSQGDGPQPVLADLDRLLDQLRASGLTIDFEQTGMPRALGTAQELSIYRIIQEAITNALRHGDRATPVALRFEWLADRVDLTITNGIAVQTTTEELHIGHGLAGMTERAALVGGSLRAEPSGRSFVVSATLPSVVTA